MSYYDQTAQPQVSSYPPPPTMAPPPAGYPMKDDGQAPANLNHPPPATQSRGDGFWKGCCAALCCCCMLDACF